jgi:dCTP deaminase
MIKNDAWIKQNATNGMIEPFEPSLIRQVDDLKVISYGLSSFGYDIRLSPSDFQIFRHIPGHITNPKDFQPHNLEPADLQYDEWGAFFILPAHSYGLGVAMERLEIPNNITCLFIGKSTYCRCGIIANLSPGEAGWRGHITIEISNSSNADARVYANEGIVQVLFLEGDRAEVSYQDRDGKYQDQPQQVVYARV